MPTTGFCVSTRLHQINHGDTCIQPFRLQINSLERQLAINTGVLVKIGLVVECLWHFLKCCSQVKPNMVPCWFGDKELSLVRPNRYQWSQNWMEMWLNTKMSQIGLLVVKLWRFIFGMDQIANPTWFLVLLVMENWVWLGLPGINGTRIGWRCNWKQKWVKLGCWFKSYGRLCCWQNLFEFGSFMGMVNLIQMNFINEHQTNILHKIQTTIEVPI